MLYSIAVISIGASCGAVLRWFLSTLLNMYFPIIMLGTLTANLIGGYLIGIAMGVFHHHPAISNEMRLFLVTGFLGGLTTFSTFSAEVTNLFQEDRLAWAFGTIGLHVTGSILLTFLGIMTVNFFRS